MPLDLLQCMVSIVDFSCNNCVRTYLCGDMLLAVCRGMIFSV
uniref:Uncharacterized protein n=1 Tax=Rhizophora mucronata TaxID=61149 RepID=A0A2P2MZX2_RHIMU